MISEEYERWIAPTKAQMVDWAENLTCDIIDVIGKEYYQCQFCQMTSDDIRSIRHEPNCYIGYTIMIMGWAWVNEHVRPFNGVDE